MTRSASIPASSSNSSEALQRASWRDYYELTKPPVVMLLLLTALVGMCLASESWIPWQTLIAGIIGIGAFRMYLVPFLCCIAIQLCCHHVITPHSRPTVMIVPLDV